MTQLAIIQMDDYRRDDLEAGFDAAFAELGLAAAFRSGEQIVIKPNMLSGLEADRAVTANPEVFRALATRLRKLDVELSFGDSPAIDTPEKAAAACGILDIAREIDVPLADFVRAVDTPMPDGRVMRQIPLAQGVAAADGLVSLGKLKTHALTIMTGAIKNQFGVIPGQRKAKCHVSYPQIEEFCQMLVDINYFLKPRLYVIDAIVAMEGNGPRNGHPRRIGAVLVSRDPVLADAAGALLMGLEPSSVLTTCLAAKNGLGTMNLQTAEACLIKPGTDRTEIVRGRADQLLAGLQVKDFVKGRIAKSLFSNAIRLSAPLFKKHIMQRPAADPGICTRCGVCAGACPASPTVITYDAPDGLPSFDYARCIRCYCCQETCPAGAIKVRITPLGRIAGV